jgi:pimeloyl-ACP methyl ester carboxylesterase
MPKFKFDHKDVYYKTVGEGKPLILLHGNSVSSVMFNQVLDDYARDFKVILVDFPGHGKSQRVDKFETDFWFYNAKVVYGLILHLGLQKVSVIGTSGGAMVALNLGLEHPECVDFVVADSFEGEFPLASYMDSLETDRNSAKQIPDAKAFWQACHGDDWEKVVDLDTQMLIEFVETGKPFFHKPISELKVPALLTGSKQDEYCDHLDKIYNDLKTQNKKLTIHLFPEGNHPAMLSNHEAFLCLIKEFLGQYLPE